MCNSKIHCIALHCALHYSRELKYNCCNAVDRFVHCALWVKYNCNAVDMLHFPLHYSRELKHNCSKEVDRFLHRIVHCIGLHWIALDCIALYCIALYCIALHCIALHCIALHGNRRELKYNRCNAVDRWLPPFSLAAAASHYSGSALHPTDHHDHDHDHDDDHDDDHDHDHDHHFHQT